MSSKPKTVAKNKKAGSNKPEKTDKQISTNGDVTSFKSKKLILPPLVQKKKNPLEELKKKTLEMQNQLNLLEKQLTETKGATLTDLGELNGNIEIKNLEIKKLSKDNQIFFQNLKLIKDEVDDKMKFVKIFKLKEEELNKKETDLKKVIELKEKELKISQRNIEIYRKDKERYEQLLAENGSEDTLPNLLSTIAELNSKAESLQNKITALKRITQEHKACEHRHKEKQNKLSLLKNEYEFQLKRENLSQSVSISKQQRHTYNERETSPYQKNKILKPKKSNENVKYKKFKTSLAPIWQELDELGENYNRSIAITTSCRLKDNRNNSEDNLLSQPNYLFKPEEKKVLSKIIPNAHLDAFQERFNRVENEKQIIEDKIRYSTNIKKKEIKGKKEKVDFSSLQMKEQNKKSVILNSEISKQKREIADLKGKIKTLKKELKFTNDLMAMKVKENDKLTSHFQEINEKIEKGLLIPKKQEQNEEENEDNDDNEENENDQDEEEED